MRRPRSQLNKLVNQNSDGFFTNGHPQSPFIANAEAEEIQRRLDAMQHQNMMMQNNSNFVNDPYSAGGFQQPPYQPAMNHAPVMNQGFEQPLPNSNFYPPHQTQQYMSAPQPPVMPPMANAQYAPQPPVMPPMANAQYAQQPEINTHSAYAGDVNQMSNSNNGQLDTIKSALEEMGSKLHSINQNNAANKAGLQQNEVLNQHYQNIAVELQQLKSSVTGLATSRNSDVGFETIRETLNANYRAIMQQLENSPSAAIDTSVFSSALDASHRELSSQIVNMKSSIEAGAIDPNAYAKTLEFSHDDIAKRLDDMHNALQTTIAQPDVYLEALEINSRKVAEQIVQLQKTVDNIEVGNSNTPELDFSSVETRLEEITRAVVALSLNDGSVDNLERIEARVSDMAKTIDGFTQENSNSSTLGLNKIETKLSDIANLMNSDSLDVKDVTLHINALSDKIDKLSENPASKLDNSGFDKLETKLSDITSLMSSSSPDIRDITSQIHVLSDKIDTLSTNPKPEFDNSGFDKLETKLSDMTNLMHASSPNISDITSQIHTLSEKFDNLSAISSSGPIAGEDNNALLQRMDDLVDQIGKSQVAPIMAEPNEAILSQLEQMASTIDQLAMPSTENKSDAQFASLEHQILDLSKQMSSVPSVAAAPFPDISFDPITERLTGIEQQLGASRDITMELATKAAEDAVKMSFQAMPQNMAGGTHNEINPAILESMSQALEHLNQSAETTNSTNVEAFGAVSQTLNMMAERLGNIETGLANYPQGNEQPPQQYIQEPIQSFVSSADETPQVNGKIEHQSEPDVLPVIEEDVKTKPRNAAADLVKAARREAEKAQPNIVDVEPPVLEEAIIEPEVNTSFEDTAPQTAMLANQTTLPEIDTPAMAMEAMPEHVEAMPEHVSENHSDTIEDVALEPGTGGPDLAALVRQANERRKNNKGANADSSGTDFIAAARRAAQAAAQEAGAVEEEIVEKKKKNLLSSIPDLFAKRKKAILMGAAALLFAALAVPLAGKFLGGQETQISSLGNEIYIEQTVGELEQETPSIAALNVQPASLENVTADVEAEILNDVAQTEAASQDISVVGTAIAEEVKSANLINVDGLDFVSAELKDAAQKGDPGALFEVGKRYTDGIGTQKDLTKASEWYERAANLGFAPAQYIIGNFNEKGLGLEKDTVVASQWYEQAAKGGNIIAMHNLAVLNATPNAISAKPNMDEAFKWFSKAADYGVRDSQVNAGIFHTKGFGTEVNLVEAYKWFSIAAKAGDKDAASKREVIANVITPTDLETAKALINDWKPLDVVQAANEVAVNEAWKPSQQELAAVSNFKVDQNVIAKTQQLLAKIGFNAGTADGVMGRKTQNAIAAFQQKSGLPVTGKINAELMQTLRAIAI